MYLYSFDETAEDWICGGETIDECLEEAREDSQDEEYVYIGYIETFNSRVNAENVWARIQDEAEELHGTYASGWLLDISDKEENLLEDLLSDAFNKWLKLVKKEPLFGYVDYRKFKL